MRARKDKNTTLLLAASSALLEVFLASTHVVNRIQGFLLNSVYEFEDAEKKEEHDPVVFDIAKKAGYVTLKNSVTRSPHYGYHVYGGGRHLEMQAASL